uniref:Rev n=1 Tax=Small ruminant lentivirus TaxID=254355 RepID=A0A0U2WB81_CAEV|nr:Rev [Small ruminant lentivirus]
MASNKRPDRITWPGQGPPLRETWAEVVRELTTRQQRVEQERAGLVTGERDQIYTGNSSDRSTGGTGGKTKRRKGWFKWLRKLKAREKNIPTHFYPDLESNCASLEELQLDDGMANNPIYEPAATTDFPDMETGEWTTWRDPPQKEKRKGGLSGQRDYACTRE